MSYAAAPRQRPPISLWGRPAVPSAFSRFSPGAASLHGLADRDPSHRTQGRFPGTYFGTGPFTSHGDRARQGGPRFSPVFSGAIQPEADVPGLTSLRLQTVAVFAYRDDVLEADQNVITRLYFDGGPRLQQMPSDFEASLPVTVARKEDWREIERNGMHGAQPQMVPCPRGRAEEFREVYLRNVLGKSRRQGKGPGWASRPLAHSLEERPYELAFILRSICSTSVSRSLLRFSYSRTFLSSSAERSSSFLATSATVISS